MMKCASFPNRCCIVLALSLPLAGSVSGGEPGQALLQSLQNGDAARLAAYTLKVTLEEPANVMLRDQGNSVITCTITQGIPGFAASCVADKLPEPVFRPLGEFNYQPMDYDPEGNLGVAMRARWFTLRTDVTNETFEVQQASLISPQGVIVDSGVRRTLHRYSPDDQGGWSLSKLRRIWWALGNGFASDLAQLEGDVFPSEKLDRMRIHGTFDGFPGGAWQMAVEKAPVRLVREARFIRDVDLRPAVEVLTRGAREFVGVTLAEAGSVRFPINDNGDAIETRVVLQDFQARFDDQLFAEVRRALQNLEGEELQVVDYRSDPKNPTRRTMRLSAQRENDDK